MKLLIGFLVWIWNLIFGTPTWDVPPKTWTSALVTVEDLNNVRNQLEYLFTPNDDAIDYDEGADKTTTNTSFTAIDAAGGTDLRASIETFGEDVACSFHGLVKGTSSGGAVEVGVYMNILVDGTTLAVEDDGLCVFYNGGSSTVGLWGPANFRLVISGLAAGVHTFDVMWKTLTSSGTPTATLYAGAGTTRLDLRPQFDVRKA